MTATDERLDGIEAVLYQRIDAYGSIEPEQPLTGWVMWLYAARNAAAAGLVARSWGRVADGVPSGLLAQAATTATLFYDAERARWRSMARATVDNPRCGAKAEGSRDECTLTEGHPGRHADPALGGTRR